MQVLDASCMPSECDSAHMTRFCNGKPQHLHETAGCLAIWKHAWNYVLIQRPAQPVLGAE